MIFRISQTSKFEYEYEAITIGLSEHSKRKALNFYNETEQAIENLTIFPFIGRSINSSSVGRTNDRETLIAGEYRLIYRVTESEVILISIIHTKYPRNL